MSVLFDFGSHIASISLGEEIGVAPDFRKMVLLVSWGGRNKCIMSYMA